MSVEPTYETPFLLCRRPRRRRHTIANMQQHFIECNQTSRELLTCSSYLRSFCFRQSFFSSVFYIPVLVNGYYTSLTPMLFVYIDVGQH